MFTGLIALLLAQSAVVADPPPVSDSVLAGLASRESLLPARLSKVITEDPAMRAEIRRVGFEKGCRAMAESRKTVDGRYRSALVPATVTAIRTKVPARALSETTIFSFMVGRLLMHRARIDAELGRIAGEELTLAADDMRRTFLKATSVYPDSSDPGDNVVMPKPDIAAALRMTGAYDLERPEQLQMACTDLLIAPANRPTITTAGPSPVFIIPPASPAPGRK